MRPEPIRILVVCTANRCRSPVAEALLWRALVLEGVPAVVRSAGFLDPGHPVDETTRKVMAERGIDLSGHRSTKVSEELVKWADLILTMERRHARELVVMAGPDLPVFTVRGFRSVVAELDEMTPVTLRRLGTNREPGALVGSDTDDDVADPIGRPAAAHRAAVEEIEEACAEIAAALGQRSS
jgi:protein-tyrosine phosphatase